MKVKNVMHSLLGKLRSHALAAAVMAAAAACMLFGTAHANEQVRYQFFIDGPLYKKVVDKLKDQELYAYLNEFQTKPYLGFFETDLNGDGIKELFVAPGDDFYFCHEDNTCDVYILMRTKDGFARAASIRANEIVVADTKTNGVRDLILFNNPHNRDEYTVYKYNREKAVYEPAK